MEESIVIRGAKEHNLKGINLSLPRNKFIVVTGLSGSGKSSLAFDTIYAEGQRRYVESLSSYARQFLDQLQKPDVEYIEGLSPAIAIEQRSVGSNPRSTVATQTEIYDYLRLLFARIGRASCYQCGELIERQSSQEIVAGIMEHFEGKNLLLLAPLISGKKGEYRDISAQIQKAGFVRGRIDGVVREVPFQTKLDKYRKHSIEVVVDRFLVKSESRGRISDSVETALRVGKGLVIVSQVVRSPAGEKPGEYRDTLFSEHYACSKCGISVPEIEPRLFSFNSPFGACPSCNGLGIKLEFDPDLVIPDKTKSIQEGALEPWKRGGRGYIMYYRWLLRQLAHRMKFDLETPFNRLKKDIQHRILYGTDEFIEGKRFEGLIPHLERLYRQTDSEYLKTEIHKFMSSLACPECDGARLKKESLAITVNGKNIYQVTRMSITESREFFKSLQLTEREKLISHQVLKEIASRLKFCADVGLDYLTLERQSSTLSGGEAQRVRLATQVGSGLVGVIYILDEPSIGLHPRDTSRLIATLQTLRDLGNTLVLVEHDESVIRAADFVVDLGPGAGRHGGKVMFSGTLPELLADRDSLTARYLRREQHIPIPSIRRKGRGYIEVAGAREHNLKNISVSFPLGTLVCVTGVSGSGKSTLVQDILYKGLSRQLNGARERPGAYSSLRGKELVDKLIMVDQSPIGRTPRSNPATYTGVFSHIRDIFSHLPEAKLRGFKPGRFSFNVKGGRCEACSGDGIKKIEMHFLPDVYVRCDVCKGKRFNDATLEVRYKGASIADVLEMTVDEALTLFNDIPAIRSTLVTLVEVGLGYIQIGQSATTLSGGEAQRIKLSSELSRKSTGQTLYILDEPTTGLHFADVEKLVNVLQRLVDKKNTVVVIEHNLEVIKSADHVIDLGPEGGDRGGIVVACGTPEEVADVEDSRTGQYLRKVLKVAG